MLALCWHNVPTYYALKLIMAGIFDGVYGLGEALMDARKFVQGH